MSLREMVNEALLMPETDRAILAAALLESLAPESDANPAEGDAELQRRIAELDRGDVVPIPWEEARRIVAGMTDGGTN